MHCVTSIHQPQVQTAAEATTQAAVQQTAAAAVETVVKEIIEAVLHKMQVGAALMVMALHKVCVQWLVTLAVMQGVSTRITTPQEHARLVPCLKDQLLHRLALSSEKGRFIARLWRQ